MSERLAPYADVLTERLGAPLGDPLYPFTRVFRFDLSEETNWAAAADRLAEEISRYAKVLRRTLGTPA